MKGKITKSYGRGANYVRIYSDKMEELLSFTPFPGTLNLKVNPKEVKELILNLKDYFIEEFYLDNEPYGAVHCYKIKINNEIYGAILIPEKTTHNSSVIEIIAPVNLRKLYNLVDGDEIEII